MTHSQLYLLHFKVTAWHNSHHTVLALNILSAAFEIFYDHGSQAINQKEAVSESGSILADAPEAFHNQCYNMDANVDFPKNSKMNDQIVEHICVI